MPGDANAAERGWLRMLIAGLVLAQIFSPVHEAAGGQSQSQIPVSAYVVVSSTITARVSATIAPSPAAAQSTSPTAASPAAPTEANQAQPKPPQICTEVAVSCSGRSRMRVSVEGGESSGDAQECATQQENTVSLCAAGANGPHGSLGLNIEY